MQTSTSPHPSSHRCRSQRRWTTAVPATGLQAESRISSAEIPRRPCPANHRSASCREASIQRYVAFSLAVIQSISHHSGSNKPTIASIDTTVRTLREIKVRGNCHAVQRCGHDAIQDQQHAGDQSGHSRADCNRCAVLSFGDEKTWQNTPGNSPSVGPLATPSIAYTTRGIKYRRSVLERIWIVDIMWTASATRAVSRPARRGHGGQLCTLTDLAGTRTWWLRCSAAADALGVYCMELSAHGGPRPAGSRGGRGRERGESQAVPAGDCRHDLRGTQPGPCAGRYAAQPGHRVRSSTST